MEKEAFRGFQKWLNTASRIQLEKALIGLFDLLNIFKDEHVIKETNQRINLIKDELQARVESGEIED